MGKMERERREKEAQMKTGSHLKQFNKVLCRYNKINAFTFSNTSKSDNRKKSRAYLMSLFNNTWK